MTLILHHDWFSACLFPDVFGATATSTNERTWVRGRRRSRQNQDLSKEVFLRRQHFRNLLRKPVRKMSFRETREMLLLAYDCKIISDEAFLVLWESFRFKNSQFPQSSLQDLILKTSTKQNV